MLSLIAKFFTVGTWLKVTIPQCRTLIKKNLINTVAVAPLRSAAILNFHGKELGSVFTSGWIKIYPDLAPTRFRIRSVLKISTLESGFICRIYRIRCCGKPNPQRKSWEFKSIRIRCCLVLLILLAPLFMTLSLTCKLQLKEFKPLQLC